MDITPIIAKTRQTITGYGDGGFRLNDKKISGSLLLYADTYRAWEVTKFSDIDFSALIGWCREHDGVELLLIGTGAQMKQISPEFREATKKQGLALEVMDTGAACRTYNILLAEERKVAAALIAL